MGFALTQANRWLAKRSGDISDFNRRFIVESHKATKRCQRWVQALVSVMVATVGTGIAAWWNQDWLKEQIYAQVYVSALSSVQESALKARDDFKECHDCPEMIVVPAGQFIMGTRGADSHDREGPQPQVTIA